MPTVQTKGRPKRRPAKPCKQCSKRTRRESGYCSDCKPEVSTAKDRKREVRGSAGSTRAWRKLRERCLRRDGFACQEPGCNYAEPELVALGKTDVQSKLHADHRVSKLDGGTDDLRNLRTLCSKHNLAKGDSSEPVPARRAVAARKVAPSSKPKPAPTRSARETKRQPATTPRCVRCSRNPVLRAGQVCTDCTPTALARSGAYGKRAGAKQAKNSRRR